MNKLSKCPKCLYLWERRAKVPKACPRCKTRLDVKRKMPNLKYTDKPKDYSRVYVGCGTDLIMSDDFGLNFTGEYAWNIAYRPWLPNFTRVDGKTTEECKYFLQTHDLSDNTLKHFVKWYEEGWGYWGWTSKFTQPYNISDGLDAYQVYVPGTTNQTFMLISSQTKAKSGGGYIISFKKALDGGDVWVDVDLSTAKIFSTDLSKYEIGGAFLEDSYADLAWVGPACHNSGYWLRSDKWEMNLSFDVAANLLKDRKKEFNVNCNVKKIRTKTFQNDALLRDLENKVSMLQNELNELKERYSISQLPQPEGCGLRLRKKSCRVWPVDSRLARS